MSIATRALSHWALRLAGAALVSAPPCVEAQPSAPYVAPPVTEADREAAFPDLGEMNAHQMMPEDPFTKLVLFDQIEAQDANGGEILSWDLRAWAGRNLDRLWIRSEGEKQSGATERAEVQVLWGHAIARWWDVVAGARQDFRPGPSQTWAAFGIQGVAPYRFEVEATAFVGEGGQTSARVEAEYELLITNRLILQPRIELNWYGQEDALRGIGSGLTTAEAGLRLRYELRREIAPYVGLIREKKFGGAADFVRVAGGDTDDTRLVAGIRLWF